MHYFENLPLGIRAGILRDKSSEKYIKLAVFIEVKIFNKIQFDLIINIFYHFKLSEQ